MHWRSPPLFAFRIHAQQRRSLHGFRCRDCAETSVILVTFFQNELATQRTCVKALCAQMLLRPSKTSTSVFDTSTMSRSIKSCKRLGVAHSKSAPFVSVIWIFVALHHRVVPLYMVFFDTSCMLPHAFECTIPVWVPILPSLAHISLQMVSRDCQRGALMGTKAQFNRVNFVAFIRTARCLYKRTRKCNRVRKRVRQKQPGSWNTHTRPLFLN